MPKMGRDGPAPERLRVDVWTNRKRDPELVEWLWRNPRIAAKKIRELLRAYLAAGADGVGSPPGEPEPITADQSQPEAAPRPLAAQPRAMAGAPRGPGLPSAPAVATAHAPPTVPIAAHSPVAADGHGQATGSSPAQPAAVPPQPKPRAAAQKDVDVRPRPPVAAEPAGENATPAEWPPTARQPAKEAPPTRAHTWDSAVAPVATPTRSPSQPPPPSSPATTSSPSLTPAPASVPAPAPAPEVAPAVSKEPEVNMTPEAIKAREALLKLVRSAPKPGF